MSRIKNKSEANRQMKFDIASFIGKSRNIQKLIKNKGI